MLEEYSRVAGWQHDFSSAFSGKPGTLAALMKVQFFWLVII
jgi:hypothetical protein